jgi:hypothetical protein
MMNTELYIKFTKIPFLLHNCGITTEARN